MKVVCAKCKTNCQKDGEYWISPTFSHYFCAFCDGLLKQMDATPIIVELFLRDNGDRLVKQKEDREILLARIKREAGNSPWKSATTN